MKGNFDRSNWLGDRDSNPNTVVQSHVSCRWTIPQTTFMVPCLGQNLPKKQSESSGVNPDGARSPTVAGTTGISFCQPSRLSCSSV